MGATKPPVSDGLLDVRAIRDTLAERVTDLLAEITTTCARTNS
jgi:hypothetical protein